MFCCYRCFLCSLFFEVLVGGLGGERLVRFFRVDLLLGRLL